MTVRRGFGIAGVLDHAIVAELAREAEQAGYSTFWANDTSGGDGLAALHVAAGVTSTISLGVGVIPIDRKPAEAIASQSTALGLPEDRLIIGIGSGALMRGALEAVRDQAMALRAKTTAKVVVGALGPRMCDIAGEAADGALLNWLVPEYVPVLAQLVRDAAARNDRPDPWVGAYVRVAVAGPAEVRLRAEAERYAGYPAYAAHFARMNVEAIETCVFGTPENIRQGLRAFETDVDEVVVRAIAAEETLDAYLEVLRAAAPSGDR
jgi:alkanesulfonate monooxygenase SsuD/methylene tetrahydromethanopterin reductase-like flavin-dependent oxidoreductase (luciferase family)